MCCVLMFSTADGSHVSSCLFYSDSVAADTAKILSSH